jgi:LysM repeat protein
VPISETFPGTIVHTVRRGDTVGNLATLYNSSIQAIIDANGLDSSALIIVGQGLVIPVRLAAPSTSTPTATPLVLVVTATAVSGGGPVAPGEEVYVVRPRWLFDSHAPTRRQLRYPVNGIVNANRIQVGQSLRVPAPGGVIVLPSPTAVVALPATATSVPGATAAPVTAVPPTPVPGQPTTYLVRPGDNLFRISLRFNVTMASLIRLNGIVNPNLIYIGQVLTIP